MTDGTESLVLTMLRAMRGDLGALRDDVREIKVRMTNVEQAIAHQAVVTAQVQVSIDRLSTRVERIVQRLSLVHPAI